MPFKATRTVWMLPTVETTFIDIPYQVSVNGDGVWAPIETDVVHIEVEETDSWTKLRELRSALNACAYGIDDSAVTAVLRDLLAAMDRVAQAGEDRVGADDALRDLARAFATAEDEQLPCLADLRGRLAELIAMWQAQWVTTGSTQ